MYRYFTLCETEALCCIIDLAHTCLFGSRSVAGLLGGGGEPVFLSCADQTLFLPLFPVGEVDVFVRAHDGMACCVSMLVVNRVVRGNLLAVVFVCWLDVAPAGGCFPGRQWMGVYKAIRRVDIC